MESMWKPHEPLPVELTWDTFIKSIGGDKISEIVGSSPSFENADYWDENKKFILELKEIETEFSDSLDFKRISPLLERLMKEDPEWRPFLFGGNNNYPEWFHFEHIRLFRDPIARIIKKANRQIRSTKENLSLIDAQGILLFVNDGFTSLSPDIVRLVAGDILTQAYSSIDCFIYLTVNRYVEVVGSDIAHLVWIPSYSEKADDNLQNFVNDLGRKWFDYLEALIGPWDNDKEDREIEIPDIFKGSRSII